MNNASDSDSPIKLENSIGFLLRQALQRHTSNFSEHIGHDLTRAQTAVLAWLYAEGPCSQNLLGRHTGIDASTIKGVVDRLHDRALLTIEPDAADKRRRVIDLSVEGRRLFDEVLPVGRQIGELTLAPLTATERETLFTLLRKIT